jgi:hypothetical protein
MIHGDDDVHSANDLLDIRSPQSQIKLCSTSTYLVSPFWNSA